jgi:hypothetical protein
VLFDGFGWEKLGDGGEGAVDRVVGDLVLHLGE